MNGIDHQAARPLAEILRPKCLNEVVGQGHLLGDGGTLRLMLAHDALGSVIFWGPPGTGKTTIARLVADEVGMDFEPVS
ncbi:MAG: AAA family ATPase, partial [Candidatus Puniceispirillum sp.]